jgi:hypothetical protein
MYQPLTISAIFLQNPSLKRGFLPVTVNPYRQFSLLFLVENLQKQSVCNIYNIQ